MCSPSRFLLAAALAIAGCGFGHQIERPDAATLVENLGSYRYIYRSTPQRLLPPQGPATVAPVPPANTQAVGMIEVIAEYGIDADGLRDSEGDFYPRLAQLAGAMGATHFVVLRSTREVRRSWITSLTVGTFHSTE
jgi:hypothetical protein